MKQQTALRTLFISAALLAGAGAARADGLENMGFGDVMAMKMVDSNKDGMVSKAEFMDMMGKLYDAKAKQMKVKGGKMTSAEFDEVLKYMRAGG